MKALNYTKLDFSLDLSREKGFSLTISKKIINDLLIVITQEILKNNFTLKNIGTFKIRYKKERIGRNPKTKESFIIKERKSISFVVSKNLRYKINE